MGAEFTGITQVLIYIGAVIVLFLFGIMLTRSDFNQDEETDHKRKFPAILTALLLLAVMVGALVDRFTDVKLDANLPGGQTPQTTAQCVRRAVLPVHRALRGGVGAAVGRPHRRHRDRPPRGGRLMSTIWCPLAWGADR